MRAAAARRPMLALVALLIACNKVGSPQFQVWLLTPLILWWLFDRPRATVPTVVVLIEYLLTQPVYPLVYDAAAARGSARRSRC